MPEDQLFLHSLQNALAVISAQCEMLKLESTVGRSASTRLYAIQETVHRMSLMVEKRQCVSLEMLTGSPELTSAMEHPAIRRIS